jgi:predicted secreted acid phosphatase
MAEEKATSPRTLFGGSTPRTYVMNGERFQHVKYTNFKNLEKPLMDMLRGVNPSTSAVVFDIDETILINDKKIDACYHARPNPGMMKIYRLCLRLQIAVYFVTARPLSDDNYDWTTKQLQCIGAGKYCELHMCPESYRASPAKVSEFKKKARARISRKSGRQIVLNAGDQWTDTLQMSSNKEVNAFISKDNRSYWLFQPLDREVLWQLKLPDRARD